MFSKNKFNEKSLGKPADASLGKEPPVLGPQKPLPSQKTPGGIIKGSLAMPKPKTTPSLISADVKIKGNLTSEGDIEVEGTISGDIQAHTLIIGQSAMITGEILADDIVVNGHVNGCVRGLKVRLSKTARVEGDIVHRAIAIESGAHFEGTVRRSEDPLNRTASKTNAAAKPKPAANSTASE